MDGNDTVDEEGMSSDEGETMMSRYIEFMQGITPEKMQGITPGWFCQAAKGRLLPTPAS